MILTDMNILIVDDEPFVLQLTEQALRKLGYDFIETASNGNVALGKLVTNIQPYDLIICDLSMPGMDGVEFLRHASNSAFNGSIIMYSGLDQRVLEASMRLADAHDLNVIGILRKPIVVNELKDLLRKFSPKNVKRVQAAMEPISIAELRRGIAAGEDGPIQLVFQPKIKISTGEIVGVEALARWQHAHRGIIPPPCFIPLAESTGLIEEFSKVVFVKAVKTAADWNKQGIFLGMSVNFSANSFAKSDLSEFVLNKIDEYQINPSQLTLEVTESQVFENSVNCLEMLIGMRLRNFGLSIDDFGTGSASMEQLKKIPFSELKIDRAFVHGASEDIAARAILETSVNLAKKLDMQIVAEGAETKEDWDLVEQLGCDLVQGYYCAKPMSAGEIVKFFEGWEGPHTPATQLMPQLAFA